MHRLAQADVDVLIERRAIAFTDRNVVVARTQMHRLVVVRRSSERAVDEDLSVLHLGV